MKYIILCGSNHSQINGVPRQLVTINGERVLDRTIRLLRENGVDDISVTAMDPAFDSVDANIIRYDSSGAWIKCFYLTDDPVTYIFGDVYFSPAAVKKIVETETDSVAFFASAPPFSAEYSKPWAEPFAFKVADVKLFHESVEKVETFRKQARFRRDPIAWETWQVIKNTPLNIIDYNNYTVINDYTSDIDCESDIEKLNKALS